MHSTFQHVVVPVSAAVALTAALVAIGAPLWLSVGIGALAALRAGLPRPAAGVARR